MRSAAPFDYLLEHDRSDRYGDVPAQERPVAGGTPGETADQEDTVAIAAREVARFWRAALVDRVGRAEIFKVLKLSGAFEKSPFAADLSGQQNDRLSDYKLGQMSVGHALYQMLAIVARDELFAMQDEYNVNGDLAVRPDRKA